MKRIVLGLVPPKTISTMQQCSGGVARVETKLSFLNQLVSGLTLGIYTPMEIVATCATRDDDSLPVVENAEAYSDAVRSGEPFLVKLR